jgi:iron complex outermembrane receptor protein
MKKSYLVFMGFLAIGLIFGGIPWVSAQEESEFTLEEITVTAEKRTENLQKVSMSVSVLKGEDVLNTGATSIADILKDVPNVSITDSGTAGGLNINIRGLGNDLPTGMGESSVSTNFDGAYEARGESTLFGYFDIDRVEVLRGPQGTLYGRNASGGVLNVVSSKPRTDKIDGYASLEVGDYAKKRVEGAVNVPISDTFAGRLAFVHTQEDNTTKDDHGFRKSMAGLATRLQLRYAPNDDTYINLLYNFTQRTGQSWSDITKSLWDSGIYDINRDSYPNNLTAKNKSETQKLSLTVEFPLGPGILTALPSYQTTEGESSGYGRGGTFSASKSPYDYTSTIAELRYANKSDSDVKWTLGLYYTKTDDPRDPDIETARGAQSLEYSSEAAFGQVTYPFSDTLRVIAGGRYDSSKKRFYDAINYTTGWVSGSSSFSYFDYKLGIENDFAKDVMGYLTLASGHKAGGFGDNGIPFDLESNVSGELGVKSRFLDNRLQVNGDIFYYLYKGYQIVDGWAETDESGNFFFHMNFRNADQAKSLGAEIETTALVGSATGLTLNLSYLNNEYTKSFIVHPAGIETNLKGKVMPHSPKYTILFGIDHTFSFSDGSTLKPGIKYKWTDEQYAGFVILPYNLAPSYGILDFTMNYTASKGWTLNFYANNALNEHYYTVVQADGAVVFPGSPRRIGATLNVRF